jgi:putative membrane protein
MLIYQRKIQKQNFYRKAIALYPQALFSFLRSDYSTFMLDDIQHPELNFNSKHGPIRWPALYTITLIKLYKDKIITDAQFININQDITDLTNICGACERIKNTYPLFL